MAAARCSSRWRTVSERATLSDANEDLITTYQVVKGDVEALVDKLREHASKHRERKGRKYADGSTYYLKVRSSEPTDPVETAARFVYLNKTCYNGLYRVNKSGRFNVPEGSYANPDICNAERLRRASEALFDATIRWGDFERVVSPNEGDVIYCDPPYDGTFTSYHPAGFGGDAQTRLRDAANTWRKKGARVVLSNADTPAMRGLYAKFSIAVAEAPRSINSNGDGRGAAPELIIANG